MESSGSEKLGLAASPDQGTGTILAPEYPVSPVRQLRYSDDLAASDQVESLLLSSSTASLTPTPSQVSSPTTARPASLHLERTPPSRLTWTRESPSVLASMKTSVSQSVSLLRRDVSRAERVIETAMAHTRLCASIEESFDSEIVASCFGHWKAKFRTNLMMRGSSRFERFNAVHLRRKLEHEGLAAGKNFIRATLKNDRNRVQRKMADGILMAWLTRTIFNRLRELAAETRKKRRLVELSKLKIALQFWNLWRIVRVRNRAENLLVKCDRYYKRRLIRQALRIMQIRAALRRVRLTSFAVGEQKARLRGLYKGLSGLSRHKTIRLAEQALSLRVRQKLLCSVFSQGQMSQKRSKSIQLKMRQRRTVRCRKRIMKGWHIWSQRHAQTNRFGRLLSAQNKRGRLQQSLKLWHQSLVRAEHCRNAAELLQRYVRGRLSRVAVQKLRAAKTREAEGLHLDISFVRWHRRYLSRQILREREFTAIESMERFRARRVFKRLNQLVVAGTLVSAALEHYTETLELRRSEKISTWRFYTRKQKKARGRRQRQDAIIRRWYLRKTLEEIYEVAMRARRWNAALSLGKSNMRLRALESLLNATDKSLEHKEGLSRSLSHHRRRRLKVAILLWTDRAAAVISEREKVEPFFSKNCYRRGLERFIDCYAAGRQRNLIKAVAWRQQHVLVSGINSFADMYARSEASASKMNVAQAHCVRRMLQLTLRNLRSFCQERVQKRNDIKQADILKKSKALERGLSALEDSFQRLKEWRERQRNFLLRRERSKKVNALMRIKDHVDMLKAKRLLLCKGTSFYNSKIILPRGFRRFKFITSRPVTRSALEAYGRCASTRRGFHVLAETANRQLFLREAYRTIRARNSHFFFFLRVVRQWQRWILYQTRLARQSIAVTDAVKRANRLRTLERWRYLVFGKGQIVMRAMTLRDAQVESRKGMAWDAWASLFRARVTGRAAVILQKSMRRWRAQEFFLVAQEATLIIQCARRCANARVRLYAILDAIEIIQCSMRCMLSRLQRQRRRDAILRIQGCFRGFQAYCDVITRLSRQLPLDDVDSLMQAYAVAVEKLQSMSLAIEMWRGARVVLGRFHMPPKMIMGAMVSKCFDWPTAVRHHFYTKQLPLRQRVLKCFERLVREILRRLNAARLLAKAELFDRHAIKIAEIHWQRRAERNAISTMHKQVLLRKAATWCLLHMSWQPPLKECFIALVTEWQAGLQRDCRPGEIFLQRCVWSRWKKWTTRKQQLRKQASFLSAVLHKRSSTKTFHLWRQKNSKRCSIKSIAQIWIRACVRFHLKEWWLSGKVHTFWVKTMRRVFWAWSLVFYSDRYQEREDAQENLLRNTIRRLYRKGIARSYQRRRDGQGESELKLQMKKRSLMQWHFWAVNRSNKENQREKGGMWLARRAS